MRWRWTLVGLFAACLAAQPALATQPIALGEPPRAVASPDDLGAALASLDNVQHRLQVAGAITLRYRQPLSPLWLQLRDDIGAIVQVQSATEASISVADASVGQLFNAAMLNGSGYLASGTGPYEALTAEDADGIAAMFEPRRQTVRPRDLRQVRDIIDLGDEAIDGQTVRHVRATLTPDYGRGLARALAPTSGSATGEHDIAASLDYAPGQLDVWIAADGRLVRETVSVHATVVPSKLGAMGEVLGRTLGAAQVSFEASFQPFDVGGTVMVTAPDVPPTTQLEAADVLALTLLMGADDAANTYAKVRGSYAGMTIATLKRLEPSIRWTRARALAAKQQVRVRLVSPRRVVFTTRTPKGRTYMLSQPLNGTPKLTCAFRGKSCRVGQLARLTAKVRSRLVRATHS